MRHVLCFITLFSFSWLSAFDSSIPVLHLPDYSNENQKKEFLEALEHAVNDVGFFAITGAGLPNQSLNSAYEQAKKFFTRDLSEKMELFALSKNRGYIPGESAKNETRKDFKELFHIGRELSQTDQERLQYEKNIWPKNLETFRTVIQPIFTHIDDCKNTLGEAFSEILGQKKGFIRNMIQEGDSLLRVVHYPADVPKDGLWAGVHTDINLFTIYPPSTAPGLQFQNKAGEWINIFIPEGMLFVHCGDMLENLSNGLCKSAIHRVSAKNPTEDRYALVFFVHPRSDDRLDPLLSCIEKTGGIRLYANLSRIELLVERLIDLGLASRELMEVFTRSGAIEKLKEVNRFSPKAEITLIENGLISQPELL